MSLKYLIDKVVAHKVKHSDTMSVFIKPVRELQSKFENLEDEIDNLKIALAESFPLSIDSMGFEWAEGTAQIIATAVLGIGDKMYSIDDGVTWQETGVFEVTEAGDYTITAKDKIGQIASDVLTVTAEPG